MRSLTITMINLGIAAGLYGTARIGMAAAAPEAGALFQLAAVFVPLLVLIPAQARLRNVVDRLLFRRRLRRQAELQVALMRLSPELGIVECCRRAMGEFVDIMQLRGAGILLDHDGSAIASGELNMVPLQRVWPRGAAADDLPSVVFTGGVFRELPAELQVALIESEVVGVTPIVSPRRRWGYGFITTSVLNASFTPEEVEAVQALAAQFALVLDAAELLDRAVAVERSLAHSEKLAAVGELAARVAHEIRNPVTAARSLAQLMVRAPASPHNAEHADLILAELEHAIEQASVLAAGGEIQLEDLPAALRAAPAAVAETAPGTAPEAPTPAGEPGAGFKESKQRVIEQFERRFIAEALARHHGNISKAAEEMGMYRQHLQLKLTEYGIDAAAFRK